MSLQERIDGVGSGHQSQLLGVTEQTDEESIAVALAKFRPAGSVLELTFGSRKWTDRILIHARRITTVDFAQSSLPDRQMRLNHPAATLAQANLRTWKPQERYDAVFVGFWLSHIAGDSFTRLWSNLRHCLLPLGRVFLVHEAKSPIGGAGMPTPPTYELEAHLRRLGWRFTFTTVSSKHTSFWGAGTIEDIW